MTDAPSQDGDLAFFEDLHPPASDFRADVLSGLSRPQKALSPKYFYDQAGSKIFDRITEAPEYYVARTELALLDRIAPDVVVAPVLGRRQDLTEVAQVLAAARFSGLLCGVATSPVCARLVAREVAASAPGLRVTVITDAAPG